MGDLPRQPDFETLLRIAEELLCDGRARRPLTKKLRRLLRRVAPRLLTVYNIRGRLGHAIPRRSRKPRMTECEADVAVKLYQGKSNKKIAAELHRSRSTVGCQVASLFRKFRVKSRVLFVRRFGDLFGKGNKAILPPLLLPFVQGAIAIFVA